MLHTVADLHSKILEAPPPFLGPIFFIFMQFLVKFGQNNWLPPHPGNPGSATVRRGTEDSLMKDILLLHGFDIPMFKNFPICVKVRKM